MLIKRIILATFTLIILLSAGCGFRLQGNYQLPTQLDTLNLSSPDQYSELTRLVKERLRLNQVTLVPPSKDVATLRIINDLLERMTLSVYPTGSVAEYDLTYTVFYAVQLPNEEAQPFNVEIHREYLDDPSAALAKSRERSLLLKEMRIQAADQIIQQLSSIEIN
ncbi:LPS-assembly lipoprotein LptE [Shewanella surugensis]|uniref:LPS-assembly lipoprotein LptE n=1 Tax=Shewanella surugensis TaxID=212020 RepID=A0ABT0L803_9GAMM|nr:LPS assembly lipoprotein LptE [Shewanella surugensis]MCL1123817.1 LPS assembly lipoprotein LptE [Shewanella surugensis]